MCTFRACAFTALAFAATSSDRPAWAEHHLAITVSGTGTLPADKIAERLREQLPNLSFSIGTVPDLREGVASGRLVRWADGRVAVGLRDELGREDVRIVEPGPEIAAAIARALVGLRATLLAEPPGARLPPESEPRSARDAPTLAQDPPARTARTRPRSVGARSGSAARVALNLGYGSGSIDLDDTMSRSPYATAGLDLLLFPGRLGGRDWPLPWLGLALGGNLRRGEASFSSRQLDGALAVDVPIGGRAEEWFHLRFGWRLFVQEFDDDYDIDDDGDRDSDGDLRYEGALLEFDGGLAVAANTFLSADVAFHAVSMVEGRSLTADGGGEPGGIGWVVRIGCRDRNSPIFDWSLDFELGHYGVDVGERDAATWQIQAIVGMALSERTRSAALGQPPED